MMNLNSLDQKSPSVEWEPGHLEAIRSLSQRLRAVPPSTEELVASGEVLGPYSLGSYQDVLVFFSCLKKAREDRGLSLSQVSKASGIDRSAISRLENGQNSNPTLDTLLRYASAIGRRLTLGIAEADPA